MVVERPIDQAARMVSRTLEIHDVESIASGLRLLYTLAAQCGAVALNKGQAHVALSCSKNLFVVVRTQSPKGAGLMHQSIE